jgi:hypothetical protein
MTEQKINSELTIKPRRFFMLSIHRKEFSEISLYKTLRINLLGFTSFFFFVSHFLFAQETPTKPAETGLGNGLQFSLNENQYQFKISGFLQPSWQFNKTDNQEKENKFLSKRSYLNFSGKALKEKVSFLIQVDFSATTPLLDAWVAYHFTPKWSLSAGQRRTFTNNRELTFDEDKLQFAERSQLSSTFAGNGREFGLFLEGKIGKSFVLAPQLAITSGDGPNSFGLNSTDPDLGGFKYGGRLDVYPMGEFSEGNQGFSADIKHESKLKLVVGVAGSLNKGASSSKGEGHGDFQFYDKSKNSRLPDYRKFSADVLLKFKGFSLLAEFMNSSAAGLAGIYTDSSSAIGAVLKPGQISQFLVLGNAFNVQAGYTTKSGYSLDVRYEKRTPEFSDQALSVLQQAEVSTLGLSKYFPDNRLKIQGTLSQVKYLNSKKSILSELMMQVVF